MPRMTPTPARLNLRAVLLLLAASALSFLLAWRFSLPDAPEVAPETTARPGSTSPGKAATGPQPSPAREGAPSASGQPSLDQPISDPTGPNRTDPGQTGLSQPSPGQPSPGQPNPGQDRPGQLRMPGQAPANSTRAALALATGAASAAEAASGVAPAAPAVLSAQANATPPGPAKPESAKPAPKAEPAKTPAKPAPEPQARPQAKPQAEAPKIEPAVVLGIVPAPGKDEFVLTIRTSRKVERYRSMNLDNPKKLAIDLMGKWTHKLKAQDLNAGFVRRLDVGDHPDFLRLVLVFDDRTKTTPIRATFSNGPEGLTVRVPR